jgi:hypothetical protein
MSSSPVAAGSPEPTPGPRPHEVCPHCGSAAVIEKSASLRFVCGVCGRARVPVDDPSVQRSNLEREALATATTARNGARGWRLTAGVAAGSSVFAVLVFLVVMAAVHPPMAVLVLGMLLAVAPLPIAAYGLRRARRLRAAIEPALDEGLRLVARDVAKSTPTLTPESLAKVLRLDEASAELLLAQLSTSGDVSTRVTDEGQVQFTSNEPVRLRVAGVEPARTNDAGPTDEELEALEQAERDAQRAGALRVDRGGAS